MERQGLAGDLPSSALHADETDLPLHVEEPTAEELLKGSAGGSSLLDELEDEGVVNNASKKPENGFNFDFDMSRAQSLDLLPSTKPKRNDSVAAPAAQYHGQRLFKQAMSVEGHIPMKRGGTLLCVRAIKARNLTSMDIVTKNDPYVVLRVGENCSISDIHNEAGSEVTFDWEAKFPIAPRKKESPGLVVSVIDHDTYTRDDLIGTCAPDPFIFMYAQPVTPFRGWFELSRKSHFRHREKKSGEILLEIWYENFQWPDTIEDDVLRTLRWIEPFPIPRLRLVTNWNFRAGLTRKILDGGHFHTFRTFQINLWEVNSAFDHQMCPWNDSYDKARRIYGGGISAAFARTCIRMQHRTLYSKNDSEAGQFEIFHVRGMRELFEALQYGKSGGRSVRYTYVIMPDGTLHFSRTSRKFGQDLLSKHALHCNCAKEVVYAGEMFIDMNSDRFKTSKTPALVIDNNSGTFAPTTARLLNLRALLELNFGHEYPVFALSRDDARLKLWFEQNNLE